MLGWVLRVVLAVAGGLTIYVIGASMLRKFKLAPPPEPDPDDIQPVNLKFRCAVCGAEVTMTAAQGDEPAAPALPGGHGLHPRLRVIHFLGISLCEITRLGFGLSTANGRKWTE